MKADILLIRCIIGLWLLSWYLEALEPSATPGMRCDDEVLGLGGSHRSQILTNSLIDIPAYWINLADSVERKRYMRHMLNVKARPIGIGHHKRIEAVAPDSPGYKIKKLEQPCKRNTPSDFAIIMSHLSAMRTAVYDNHQSVGESPYALILEDDVEFLYDINLHSLIRTAPPDFGVLQLMTSNIEAIDELWDKYTSSHKTMKEEVNLVGKERWTLNHWQNTTGNGKYARYWGALGYIINKKVVKPFLDDVIEHDDKTDMNSYKLINSFFPNRCQRTRDRPCVLANCLFSDTYIYSGAGPTYVSNVPLVTSGKVASTAHENHIQAHETAFKRIGEITQGLKGSEAYKKCIADSSPSPSAS